MSKRLASPAECIFCARQDQPPTLFETPSTYVTPDKFPLLPGHVLIITRQHFPCLAAAPLSALRELDEAASRVRHFLETAYGGTVLAWENGISGQTVFHAHLHLLPLPVREVRLELGVYPQVQLTQDWATVQAYFARHGHYRYLELDGTRCVMAAHSPAVGAVRGTSPGRCVDTVERSLAGRSCCLQNGRASASPRTAGLGTLHRKVYQRSKPNQRIVDRSSRRARSPSPDPMSSTERQSSAASRLAMPS